jgi:hypothetical protein
MRYGMSACLAVGRRGQAPQPRSGASQTPGLRAAADSGIMGSAGSRRLTQGVAGAVSEVGACDAG